MGEAPIIGGNWATTEPRYRKPEIKPSKGKLFKLTDVELDTLDALLVLGRASRVQEVYNLLGNLYSDETTVSKCLRRLTKFGCVEKVVHSRYPGYSFGTDTGKKLTIDRYRITGKGTEALNESLDALEVRMMESNPNGIRRNRKRS